MVAEAVVVPLGIFAALTLTMCLTMPMLAAKVAFASLVAALPVRVVVLLLVVFVEILVVLVAV